MLEIPGMGENFVVEMFELVRSESKDHDYHVGASQLAPNYLLSLLSAAVNSAFLKLSVQLGSISF